MRKIQILGLALFAVFAFSAVAAASAFATEENGQWLVAGVEAANNTAVDSEGELELTDEGTGVTVLCSGLNEGTVSSGGKDQITKITSLAGNPDIPCTQVSGPSCPTPLAEAVHLPWNTQLLLIVVGGVESMRDDITTATAGWAVTCHSIINLTDTCEGESSTAITNEAGGLIDALFDAKTANVKCSIGGANKGKVRGLITFLLTSGLALTAD